jgi:hypothetical protein
MGISAIDTRRRGLKAIRMSETHAELQMIETGREYELLSATNSSMFILRFKPENLAARLEGDDAARFREDYAVIRQQFPAWTADQALAQLWDQGGYSWLAAHEE